MIVRYLEIDNFRGINHLKWSIPSNKKTICIVGPGDSGKTSILDALDWLLGDRWNIPVSIDDFRDELKPIRVSAILCDLPADLTAINVHGLHLCGLDNDGVLVPEPEDGTEACLYVELLITTDLEPSWSVIRPNTSLNEPLRASDRRKLGVAKLDDRINVHLRWSHSSALGKVSRDTDGAKTAMQEAIHAARSALKNLDLSDDFIEILENVKSEAQKYGAMQRGEMSPGLDSSLSNGYGSLALYSGVTPVYKFGLGTRRLTSLAIQKLSATGKSTLLIDEIESGLEPHRVIGLIETLRRDESIDQVFLTTHSSNAVESCSASEICVLSNRQGNATCAFVPQELEGLHRSNPSPFLARSIVVVEGQTEEGLYRAFAAKHDENSRRTGMPTLAALGTCICQGQGGAHAVDKALSFSSLGYKVALLIDSDDEEVNERAENARAHGVIVYKWPSGWCVENAIFDSLDDEHITSLVKFMISNGLISEDRIASDFKSNDYSGLDGFLSESKRKGLDDSEIRCEIASIAAKRSKNNKGWFKTVRCGVAVGKWLVDTACENRRFEQSHLKQVFSEILSDFPIKGNHE